MCEMSKCHRHHKHHRCCSKVHITISCCDEKKNKCCEKKKNKPCKEKKKRCPKKVRRNRCC